MIKSDIIYMEKNEKKFEHIQHTKSKLKNLKELSERPMEKITSREKGRKAS